VEAQALGDGAEELGGIFAGACLGGVEDEGAPVVALAGDGDGHGGVDGNVWDGRRGEDGGAILWPALCTAPYLH
jgi:hypothetical protein